MPGEILFSAGPLCEHMLFVSHGSIRYRKLTDAADAGFANTGDAGAGRKTAQYFFCDDEDGDTNRIHGTGFFGHIFPLAVAQVTVREILSQACFRFFHRSMPGSHDFYGTGGRLDNRQDCFLFSVTCVCVCLFGVVGNIGNVTFFSCCCCCCCCCGCFHIILAHHAISGTTS